MLIGQFVYFVERRFLFMRQTRTKDALKKAFISLIEEKSFDQITTTELVKTAKISRSSFYTHYQDKYEMIDSYQKILFNTIQYIFDKSQRNVQETLLETYEFLYENEIYAALLSENSSKEIHQFMQSKLQQLLETTLIPENSKRKNMNKAANIYASSYYSQAIFGLTQMWIRRNRRETPAQITAILMTLIQ